MQLHNWNFALFKCYARISSQIFEFNICSKGYQNSLWTRLKITFSAWSRVKSKSKLKILSKLWIGKSGKILKKHLSFLLKAFYFPVINFNPWDIFLKMFYVLDMNINYLINYPITYLVKNTIMSILGFLRFKPLLSSYKLYQNFKNI